MNEPQMPDEQSCDGEDDFAKSLIVAYEAIRLRVASGGPGWIPGATLEEAERKRRARQEPLTSA
jgi:hypothetical protein